MRYEPVADFCISAQSAPNVSLQLWIIALACVVLAVRYIRETR